MDNTNILQKLSASNCHFIIDHIFSYLSFSDQNELAKCCPEFRQLFNKFIERTILYRKSNILNVTWLGSNNFSLLDLSENLKKSQFFYNNVKNGQIQVLKKKNHSTIFVLRKIATDSKMCDYMNQFIYPSFNSEIGLQVLHLYFATWLYVQLEFKFTKRELLLRFPKLTNADENQKLRLTTVWLNRFLNKQSRHCSVDSESGISEEDSGHSEYSEEIESENVINGPKILTHTENCEIGLWIANEVSHLSKTPDKPDYNILKNHAFKSRGFDLCNSVNQIKNDDWYYLGNYDGYHGLVLDLEKYALNETITVVSYYKDTPFGGKGNIEWAFSDLIFEVF